jgi:N-formylglutamate amidohydrolase
MNKYIWLKVCVFLSITFTSVLLAQTYEPPQVYYGRNNYVEYYPGDLALVFTAPHGGSLTPAEIPDRTYGTTVTDSYTKETTIAIRNAVFTATGKHPHIIISNLKRTKLDPNREIVEAAQGNQWAEQAWNEFHEFIEIAKDTITAQYGKGLLVDMHGHGHTIQRLELGYLVYGSNLFKSDSELNAYASSSSIRALAEESSLSFAELVRGSSSLGALFEDNGIQAVPSLNQQDPGSGNLYFSGGYTTSRHGSRDGGTINAVQIEAYRVGLRDTDANRKQYAGTIVDVFDEYLNLHFGWDGLITDIDEIRIIPEKLYLSQNFPNPFNPSTILEYEIPETSEVELNVYDMQGRLVNSLVENSRTVGRYKAHWNGTDDEGRQVSTGMYFARLQAGGYSSVVKMVYLR